MSSQKPIVESRFGFPTFHSEVSISSLNRSFAFLLSLYVHSILLSCSFCRSMVPCFPCSLYVNFLFVSGQVFLAFYVLWQSCQKGGRNLRFACHFLRGVIDLGGELHVKKKKIFWCNNLRGRVSLLVWYTLILIYFVLCIFWFCNYLRTSCVVSIYDDDVCVSLFISHMLFLFSLYTHVSCLFNLSLFSI